MDLEERLSVSFFMACSSGFWGFHEESENP